MLVRLKGRAINLRHLAMAEDAEGGGMKVFLVGDLERDLDPEDAERLRRRFRELDPEPLPGEASAPAGLDAGELADLTESVEVREVGGPPPRPRRGRRTG